MNDDNEVLDAITAKIIEGGPIYDIDHLAADILTIVKNGNQFVAMSEFAKREEDWARDIDTAEGLMESAISERDNALRKLKKIHELLEESP